MNFGKGLSLQPAPLKEDRGKRANPSQLEVAPQPNSGNSRSVFESFLLISKKKKEEERSQPQPARASPPAKQRKRPCSFRKLLLVNNKKEDSNPARPFPCFPKPCMLLVRGSASNPDTFGWCHCLLVLISLGSLLLFSGLIFQNRMTLRRKCRGRRDKYNTGFEAVSDLEAWKIERENFTHRH